MQPSPILQRAIKRLALNTKQAGKDYYKGTGTGAMGRHTNRGGYIIEWKKVRTYVCPSASEFEDFNLSPFIAKNIEARKDTFKSTETRSAMDGKRWLEKWKANGGAN